MPCDPTRARSASRSAFHLDARAKLGRAAKVTLKVCTPQIAYFYVVVIDANVEPLVCQLGRFAFVLVCRPIGSLTLLGAISDLAASAALLQIHTGLQAGEAHRLRRAQGESLAQNIGLKLLQARE